MLAAISLIGAIVVAMTLPRERRFRRSEGFVASGRQMLRHIRNPQLIAIYAVGFGVLFNFIAVFTYVSFHLAAPPYDFTPAKLGLLFVTYLAGILCAPMTGWAVTRFGRRGFILGIDGDLGGGPRPSARGAGVRDRARARAVRGLRDAMPGDLDRLRHRDRP